MSLDFIAICPHPPLIIPEIGGDDSKKCINTIKAMDKLSDSLDAADPDTIIIISPHAVVHSDRFAVYANPRLLGNFNDFGAPNLNYSFSNDLNLAKNIVDLANDKDINTFLFGDTNSDYFQLDHGELVPLHCLKNAFSKEIKIVPIAYSFLDNDSHYNFGKILQEVCADSHKRVAIIASGDLSHKLNDGNCGRLFDNKIIKLLRNQSTTELLDMDNDFVNQAGECGFRSILVALGSLDNINYKTNILSYEGPFGVGYLVANFDIIKE